MQGLAIPKISIPKNFLKITPEAVAELIDKKDPSYVLIDVRGGDYVGGHILGAINIPYNAETFESKCEAIKKDHGDKKYIIFYCMYGSLRSPAAALDYIKTLGPDGETSNVFVLLDGFFKWIAHYKDAKEPRIEGLDLQYWNQNPDAWEHVHDFTPRSGKPSKD